MWFMPSLVSSLTFRVSSSKPPRRATGMLAGRRTSALRLETLNSKLETVTSKRPGSAGARAGGDRRGLAAGGRLADWGLEPTLDALLDADGFPHVRTDPRASLAVVVDVHHPGEGG